SRFAGQNGSPNRDAPSTITSVSLIWRPPSQRPPLSIGLKRFATGTYVVWYPIIPRPQAHSLPRHLTNLARQADKPWLHATLRIRTGARDVVTAGDAIKPIGLVDSGVIVINPPFTLHEQLQQALPQMVQLMGQDHMAGFQLTQG
ncbi:MAG: 23S rRNA (adenine(2030)-N(6))-methyltransferase RlmJ, partial [Betaproteobacteria bacterium]|nr:23S rRNA (adenine(2030)-N(6))-methyltransferase RlmJ [Betaproteobacteria bacterium]